MSIELDDHDHSSWQFQKWPSFHGPLETHTDQHLGRLIQKEICLSLHNNTQAKTWKIRN